MKYLLFLFFFFIAADVRALPNPTEDRLRLVHMLLGEAGWRPANDHPAILHVLERRRQRAGLTLTEMAEAYSAFLKPAKPSANDLPHRESVYALTLETAPQWVVKLVDAFIQAPETVPDPCKGQAWNWGSPGDFLVSKLNRVDCGDTNNVFCGNKVRDVEVTNAPNHH